MESYILKTNPDGSVITIHDVQMVLLEMLKDIDKVCREHDIPYFLNGGSALGAVRHKGFIPWDDDADISMMIKDYRRFQAIAHHLGDKYVIHCFETCNRYNVLIPGMKIRKKGTYIKEANNLLANRCTDSDGIFVDVFVYDYVSPNKALDLPLRLLNQALMPFIVFFENIKINPLPLKVWFLGNARIYGKMNRNSKYIGFDLTWTFKSPFKPFIFKKDDIYPVQYVTFEDTMLPIAAHPHEYLCTAIAPSYNTLPPVEARKPKHITDIRL
ncbi:MAG: LICD family protein [Erysipelotrichaceae bacterium]|nr:MAG: LICD family [Erysipelotrichaceae bacterium]TXT19719.1 MAG: LICD family protein [Erysipelotrichaceae bacterium]